METRIAVEQAIQKINSYYVANGYAKTTAKAYMRLGKELLGYLNQEGLEGTEMELRAWLTLKMEQHAGHYHPVKTYHHYVNRIIRVLKTDIIESVPYFDHHGAAKRPSTEVWQRVLDEYLAELDKEEKAKATIDFSCRACSKFIRYLELQGCFSPADLTRELIWKYQKEETGHTKANGKRAYLYRIRMFIRHLQRKALVDLTLEYAINTRYRIPQKVVTTLTTGEKLQVHQNRNTTDSLMNRDYAMATLALYLGFRSCDIVSLRFSSISWTQNTITIIQQKTKATLALPLVSAVGNAIADYALHHRPSSDSPFVFISHRAPFGRLTRTACYGASIHLLANQDNHTQSRGLHVMRRSFATELLKNRVQHELVSSILGHVDQKSIDPYLGLDEERMGKCSIGLDLIGMPEVFR
jgi:site-specific recombinase XerD